MKCDCECNCSEIPSHEAMDDRLYWVEILTGAHEGKKFTAWRDRPGSEDSWLVSRGGRSLRLSYADDEIRVIHEIIPED